MNRVRSPTLLLQIAVLYRTFGIGMMLDLRGASPDAASLAKELAATQSAMSFPLIGASEARAGS